MLGVPAREVRHMTRSAGAATWHLNELILRLGWPNEAGMHTECVGALDEGDRLK